MKKAINQLSRAFDPGDEQEGGDEFPTAPGNEVEAHTEQGI